MRVVIPWRRRDLEPEKKNVIVVDAATGERVANVLALAVDREYGDILFEPRTVPGDYYVYYMPYKSEGRKNYPNVKYDPPQATADPAWLAANGLLPDKLPALRPPSAFPRAAVVELQSADEFSAFTPMEMIATAAETKVAPRGPSRLAVSPLPRRPDALHPHGRTTCRSAGPPTGPRRDRPGRGGARRVFRLPDRRLGGPASRSPTSKSDSRTSSRPSPRIEDGSPAPRTLIPAAAMTCFNKGGIDWDGSPFQKTVPVEKGKIQALWCGVQVPRDARPGVFNGTVTVAPKGLPETILAVELRVTADVLEDAGDGDPFRMTRLRWLDSTLAQDDDIVPPYTPLAVDEPHGRAASAGR